MKRDITPPSALRFPAAKEQTVQSLFDYLQKLVRELNALFAQLGGESVRESGESGIWRFTTKENGEAECTATVTIRASALIFWGGMQIKEAAFALPRGLFVSPPSVTATPISGRLTFFALPLPDGGADAVRIGIFCPEDIPSQKDFTVRLQIKGRWK